MASETMTKQTCTLRLANGTTESGATKYISMSLGSLANGSEAWDAAKAVAIVSALVPCLDKSVSVVLHTPTFSVQS